VVDVEEFVKEFVICTVEDEKNEARPVEEKIVPKERHEKQSSQNYEKKE